VKGELQRIAVPDGEAARARAWSVVAAAFAAREPVPRTRARWPLAVALAAAALVAAFASPPGRAVLDDIRQLVGVERAQPALFSLPTNGRLLVASDSGVWLVREDGSRRLLGPYREASWSPLGRYVVAARQNELAALAPEGEVRWTLARPAVRFPRWTGTAADTRIAYLTTSRLHVVAGDGTDDGDAGGLPAAARLAPAWRPTDRFVLAYVNTRGRVYAFDLGGRSDFWALPPVQSPPFAEPRQLAWSDDGRRLVLVTRTKLALFGPRTARPLAVASMRGVDGAAFEPGSHRLAVVRSGEVLVLDTDRPARRAERLFASGGSLSGVTWSADGRWLLVSWPAADQWIFVRADGRRIRAVSNVSEQFRSQTFPRVEGWCCTK
jgi:hypothetical protein